MLMRLSAACVLLLALTACGDSTDPKADPGAAVALVEARRDATCALTADGRVFCWGVPVGGFTCENACVETPALVPSTQPFDTLALGGSIFEEAACALGADRLPHCWGSLLVNLDQPAHLGAVPTPLSNALPLRTVAIGTGHICGIGVDGKTFCWGDYDGARRGQETVSPGGVGTDFVPNEVRGGHAFVTLQASAWNTCGIDAEQRAWCWGAGEMLGNTTAPLLERDPCGYAVLCTFEPVPIEGGHRLVAFAGRDGCGITTAGALVCWGGALRDPPRAPEVVALPISVSRAVKGREHQCVLDTNGAAWCWGSNDYGQLGIGAAAPTDVPTRVKGRRRFRWLTAGSTHTCGVTTDEELFCWGANDSGQLGTGGRAGATEPVRISVPG